MNTIIQNIPQIITGLVTILSGVIGICLLIPGSEPEATLQKIVDFISKFSRKPPTQ